ncbi:hypothetical protein ACGFYV_17405 [Streptomyces sp. NPDC048297]|uniref:hypothetical protein n=1 Tax=Streptomyces sp. NPDC048297 TaxID=3365531 RepID=UPI00371CDB2A
MDARPRARMAARRAGDAWLLHPAGALDQRSWMYAAGLARDPEYTLAVVDVPRDASPGFLHDLAQVLPAGGTGLRLVFGRTPPGGTAQAGQWLATRSGRIVVAPLGRPRPTAEGALFVGPDRGQGWIRYDPAGGASLEGHRFPRPAWEYDLPPKPFAVAERTVAEPVPAGLWLRPARTTPQSERHRAFLTTRLSSRPDAVTVVVGEPGADPVPLADVARFCRSLPEHVRLSARFTRFGPVALPADMPFGTALAAEAGMTVHTYNGLLVAPGSPATAGATVMAVGPDGALGRPMMTRESVQFPPLAPGEHEEHRKHGEHRGPVVTDHQWPLQDLPLLRTGVHRHGPDAVIEVVLSGLWVRGPQEQAVTVPRFAPVDERHELVMYSSGDSRTADEFRRIAEALARRVRAERGVPVQVRAVGPWSHAERPPVQAVETPVASVPAQGPGARKGETSQEQAPQEQAPQVRAPQEQAAQHSAFGHRHEEAVAFASALLRRQPALLGTGEFADAVAELAMLRLYMLADGDLPFPAGLNRLPVFAGPVALRASLTDAGLSWYTEHATVVAHQGCATTFSGTPGQPGNTDFVVWSVTGRRTAVLEAGDPDVVLFPPGTSFAVLRVRRAVPGERDVVFLRELDAPDGRPDPDADRAALRRLEPALADWRRDESAGPRRSGPPGRLFPPPGLGTANRLAAAARIGGAPLAGGTRPVRTRPSS